MQQHELPDDAITTGQAAKLLRCRLSIVYRWIFKGKLRAWKRNGTRYLVSKADVLALVEPVAVPGQARDLTAVYEQLRKAGVKV